MCGAGSSCLGSDGPSMAGHGVEGQPSVAGDSSVTLGNREFPVIARSGTTKQSLSSSSEIASRCSQ